SRPAAVKLPSRPAASNTIRLPAEGRRWRRFCISRAYRHDEDFPASQSAGSQLIYPKGRKREAAMTGTAGEMVKTGETAEAGETAKQPAARRERGGRSARREQRAHSSQGLGQPYILRNIPTYDVLSEENLLRIEE